jgi:hypothetical protein
LLLLCCCFLGGGPGPVTSADEKHPHHIDIAKNMWLTPVGAGWLLAMSSPHCQTYMSVLHMLILSTTIPLQPSASGTLISPFQPQGPSFYSFCLRLKLRCTCKLIFGVCNYNSKYKDNAMRDA